MAMPAWVYDLELVLSLCGDEEYYPDSVELQRVRRLSGLPQVSNPLMEGSGRAKSSNPKLGGREWG